MVARVGSYRSIVEVVQIVIPERRAVGEGGEIRRALASGTDDRGVALRVMRNFATHTHRPLVVGGDAAAERVDHV